MKIFLSGGVRNGKSDYAQQLALALAGTGPRYYMATLIPHDEEDQTRIRSHLQRRDGMGFETLDCGTHLLRCFRQADPNGTFLLDSLTALMTNELFSPENNYAPDEAAAARCVEELECFLNSAANAVIVSDNVHCECSRYSPETETFLRWLGKAGCVSARLCDTVAEFSAGIPILYKGRLPL